MVNPTGKARACRAVLVADEEFPAHMGFALLLLPPAMHGAPLVLPLHSALCLVERKEQVCPYQHRVVQPQELACFFAAGKVFEVHFKTISNCEMQSLHGYSCKPKATTFKAKISTSPKAAMKEEVSVSLFFFPGVGANVDQLAGAWLPAVRGSTFRDSPPGS